MSRLLVTGASGFIGRAVVTAWAMEGRTVRAAVRRPPQPPFLDTVEVMQHADLTQPVDWQALLAGVDQVVHLAGVSHIGRGADPMLYDRVNRVATAQLAMAAAQAGVRHFVFVSSIRAQSGFATDRILTERDAAAPTDDYGRSKLAAEGAVGAAGVPFTILRPVLLYGPGVKGNFARLARVAVWPVPLPVKHFANRRSILGIDNFISALRFVLSTPATIGETYAVADPGIPPRLAEVVGTLREARGRGWAPLFPMPTQCFEEPLRMIGRGDVWDRLGGNLRVDTDKLIAAGWRPSHDTRVGLVAMAQAAAPRKSGTASRNTR